jgi:hypothetical protein
MRNYPSTRVVSPCLAVPGKRLGCHLSPQPTRPFLPMPRSPQGDTRQPANRPAGQSANRVLRSLALPCISWHGPPAATGQPEAAPANRPRSEALPSVSACHRVPTPSLEKSDLEGMVAIPRPLERMNCLDGPTPGRRSIGLPSTNRPQVVKETSTQCQGNATQSPPPTGITWPGCHLSSGTWPRGVSLTCVFAASSWPLGPLHS